MKQALVLLGMPGAGKSTLGKQLAQKQRRPFIDTDRLIEEAYGKPLQQLLDEFGYQAMRQIEGDTIAAYKFPPSAVLATGGSVVYSAKAMDYLGRVGLCVFLEISLPTVYERVQDFETRGLLRAPGQSLEDVFDERQALYRKYAHRTIQCDGLTEQEALAQLRAVA